MWLWLVRLGLALCFLSFWPPVGALLRIVCEGPTGGVSVHWVTSELDGGEIILQKELQKNGLGFEEYDAQVRALEKVALEEAIRKVLM